MVRNYIPERSDLVWLEFQPQAGHEQSGRRPALVLSPSDYNSRTDLALVCPITSQIKGYPFEVPVATGKVVGVILADQIRCLDWKARKARFIGRVADDVLADVIMKVTALLA